MFLMLVSMAKVKGLILLFPWCMPKGLDTGLAQWPGELRNVHPGRLSNSLASSRRVQRDALSAWLGE